MTTTKRIFPLYGKVQHYAWGGNRFIPELLGEKNTDRQPFAEYWMGAHDQVPSLIETEHGVQIGLNSFIRENTVDALGEPATRSFGRLPFLFKVLDVKEMLSIQVHPTREEAIKGFAREEAAGISAGDPSRNYKDDNHKPEVMVALSDFWLLHGFRKKEAIRHELEQQAAWHFLIPVLEEKGIKGLYETVMNASQEEVDKMLAPLAEQVLPLYKDNLLSKADPAFWAARAIEQYSGGKVEKLDRGIFSIYFFNLVHLKEGEAVFQGAGIPHAYLEGQNMELMANSDNVLRGGLTPKHIDVAELIKHTSFEEVTPVIMQPAASKEGIIEYPCPVPDFSISAVELPTGGRWPHKTYSAEIVFVQKGQVEILSGETILHITTGGAAFVLAETPYELVSKDQSTVFIAGVPR
ncbi:MAG: mannose-6-phosphate isomerase, class I [Chitinophagaceae bacterium]